MTANQRVYSENLGELNGCDGDLLGWEIRTNVNHQFLYNFLECVMEISHALQGLAGNWKPGKTAKVVVQGPLMISATRRISTAVRKIMLDGNGSLLKRCVDRPDIHPLKAPEALPPITSFGNLRNNG